MCRETCVYSAAVRDVLIKSGLSDLTLYLRDCSPFFGSVRNTTTVLYCTVHSVRFGLDIIQV